MQDLVRTGIMSDKSDRCKLHDHVSGDKTFLL